MLLLPADISALLGSLAPLCSRRTWRHVPILVAGAILAPGRRMVSSALRAGGLGQVRTLQTDHRVLNRASWSGLGASRILRGLLVATFASPGPLVVGSDETTRATAWRQDRGRWHLPRSSPLQSLALR